MKHLPTFKEFINESNTRNKFGRKINENTELEQYGIEELTEVAGISKKLVLFTDELYAHYNSNKKDYLQLNRSRIMKFKTDKDKTPKQYTDAICFTLTTSDPFYHFLLKEIVYMSKGIAPKIKCVHGTYHYSNEIDSYDSHGRSYVYDTEDYSKKAVLIFNLNIEEYKYIINRLTVTDNKIK